MVVLYSSHIQGYTPLITYMKIFLQTTILDVECFRQKFENLRESNRIHWAVACVTCDVLFYDNNYQSPIQQSLVS